LLTLIPMVMLGLVARKGFSTLLLVIITVSTIFLLGLFWADVIQLITF